MLRSITLLFLSILFSLSLFAQQADSLTLEQCIQRAFLENIGARRAILGQKAAASQLKTSQFARIPSLNASVSDNYNFGRTIDPFSNQFVTTSVNSYSFGLNSGVTLFSGFSINNNIRSSEYALEASTQSLEATKNDVALNVANLYLQIVLARELVKANAERIKLTEEQLTRAKILIDAGAATKDQELEMLAQLSNDESALVNSENQLALAEQNLKVFLNMSIEDPLNVKSVSIETPSEETPTNELADLVNENYQRQPAIKSAELNVLSNEYSLKSAQGGRYPTLSLSGNINSLYSSANKTIENPGIELITIGQVAETGQSVTTARTTGSTSVTPFSDQIEGNFGQSVFLSLQIPIFSQNRINNQVEQSQVRYEQSMLDLEQAKNDLRNNIYLAQTNLTAAQKTFDANKKRKEAQQLLFDQADIRYKAGTISYYEWSNARNALTLAQNTLIQSRFDMFFKSKVYDFYLGKPLSF